ncbi:hypothetical protein EW145_g3846 [Phellinidium pouzarii]|uniref:Protein kinase domain-containing protein n=1 Tax=Phellinidium pouzarii TaxID=167371 RepID=A0A4S4L5X5_9AGAM|nr:hypothetical protein EW145_g3846 [Phellinidium pouzarii]
MNSSHVRSRRHQRHEDDDELLVSRVDERRADSYSRSHPHSSRTEAYGASSTSHRVYPVTSSHSHRSDEWRTSEAVYSSTHDRYRSETYSQSRRRDYYERPENWTARPTEHAHYSSTTHEWTKREDPRHSTTSFSETRAWAAPSRYEETVRNGNALDEWPRDEIRQERERGRYNRDENHSTQDHGWRAKDSAWVEEPARDRKALKWTERTDDQRQWRTSNHDRERARDPDRDQDRSSHPTGRQWEPAATWKYKEQDDSHSYRNERAEVPQSLPRYIVKKSTKNKKKAQQTNQKRDERKEDNMNNWQRRDYRPGNKDKDYTKTSAGKRRHAYSPESRSRSPAHSVYSRHSSKRSKSRSLSPKRRRRADEPVNLSRKDVSLGRSVTKKNDDRIKSPVWSPSSPAHSRRIENSRGRSRRPSIYSPSSISRSRSRSRSRSSSEDLDVRRKVKHRLPAATSLRDIELQAKTMRLSGPPSSRQNDGRNGHTSKGGEKADHRPSIISSVNYREADVHRDEHEIMPPPAAPLQTNTYDAKPAAQPPSVVVETQMKGMKRSAGFRPIGFSQSSASIKRFFPGEDDDSDSSNQQTGLQQDSGRPPSPHLRAESKVDMRAQYSPDSTRQGNRIDPPNWTDSTNGGTSREGSMPPARLTEMPAQTDSAFPSPSMRQNEEEREKHRPVDVHKDQLYAIVSQVGEGTFGKVYKARNTVSGIHVALKRIRMEAERDGFPVTAMREIKLLQSLRHVNVVQLMEMMVHHGSVYMVFEYMDHDLTGVLSQTQFAFTNAHLKSLCQQMLQGLSYLHRKGVIHRDIKGSNILLNNRGELKLADFGLARFYQKRRRADYTNRVITLWYRPPELLLGTTIYGPEVDMWSAGCIMLELFCKKPVFQGNDEIHQLDVVYKILGTPTSEEWPGLADMPWYELVKPKDTIRNRFRDFFHKWLSPAGLDLAERLLSYNPTRRATADQALEAPYFNQEEPAPMLPIGLSSLEGEWHEFESKRERAKKRRKLEIGPGNSSGHLAQ